uniref:Uncharacterized protein n=1 Tax=viral metagenome TaxID=1070528 RepID=A0A6M3K730_9ZZZZ
MKYYLEGLRFIIKCAKCQKPLGINVIDENYIDLNENENVRCYDLYTDIKHECIDWKEKFCGTIKCKHHDKLFLEHCSYLGIRYDGHLCDKFKIYEE